MVYLYNVCQSIIVRILFFAGDTAYVSYYERKKEYNEIQSRIPEYKIYYNRIHTFLTVNNYTSHV